MKSYTKLVDLALKEITELFPWDLEEELNEGKKPLLVDIREPYEFQVMRIANSLNVPRGIIESACDWGYEETVPELACAREREVILICRSGNRSVLAAQTLQEMGYTKVRSLKTGLRGWNDNEQPLVDDKGQQVELEAADTYFVSRVSPEQLQPKC